MTKSSNAARTAEATPNLRERAERLRDAAGRFVRRTPAEPARDVDDAAADASPELVSMVAEWTKLTVAQDSGDLSDEEADAISPEWSRLHGDICRFPVRSLADLTAKAPLYRYERDDERASCKGASTMPLRAWESVVQDIEALSVLTSHPPGPDPILAAIAETRRLTIERTTALAKDLPPGAIDPTPEQNAAAQQVPPRARQFIDSFDLSRMGMRDLAAIHDAAGLIGGVADAVSCQPRSYTPNHEAWNVIGLFADAVSEACGAVQADAVREARERTPGDDWEQGLRLNILAQETIENGDQSAMAAFARDLQAMG